MGSEPEKANSGLMTEEGRWERFPQVRCPMLEQKDWFSLPDSDTPQCKGKPDNDPPKILKPYFQSVHFGDVKMCRWHAERLASREDYFLRILQIAFGNELTRQQRLFMESPLLARPSTLNTLIQKELKDPMAKVNREKKEKFDLDLAVGRSSYFVRESSSGARDWSQIQSGRSRSPRNDSPR